VADVQTTYNTRGLPTTATNATTGETVTYTHDAVGNLTLTDSSIATNDWSQTFDAYSRMTCAKQATTCASGTTRVQLTYDALDRTRTRINNSVTTTYTYSGISEQLAKTVAGSTTTTYASTPGGHPMAQRVGSAAVSYHLLDTHSDVVGLVTTAAANQGTTAYDAYGGVLGVTGTQGIVGYQGDITDPTTKQVDMGTRWYVPGQGRFTSRDVLFGELGSPMTLNQFAYAGGNPITMWDPTGMLPTCRPECSSDQEKDLTDWYSDTVTEAGGYSTPYDPSPPQPQPAPSITYKRESGDYAISTDGCARRCGTDTFANAEWGEDVSLSGVSDTGEGKCALWLLCAVSPNGLDRGAGWLLDKTVWWGIATAARHVGRADSRPCGSGTCYDNANFIVPPGASAWTAGTRIFCRDVCSDTIVKHEQVHVAQWATQGASLGPRYVYQSIVNGTKCSNPWEAPAYGDSC